MKKEKQMGGNDLFSNQELKEMIVPLFLVRLIFRAPIFCLRAAHLKSAARNQSQLLMFSFGFSVLLGAAVLLGNEAMLCLLYSPA